MRTIVVITAIIAICCPVAAQALTGLSIGGKVGFSEYSGNVLPASGDVGSGTSYGLILGIGTLPLLDIEFRADYYSKEFDYTYDVAGVPVTAPFEFRDVSVAMLLRKNVFAPMASPFAFYVGAGLGMHMMNTEVAKAALQGTFDPGQADQPVVLLSNQGKMSGEGLIGFRAGLPAFPLKFFGEARYAMVFADERINITEFAAGIMLSF